MKNMEDQRPRLLKEFKNNPAFSTDNDKNKNIVGPNIIVPEVDIDDQFYDIDVYHSIPGSHAKLWKDHVQELLGSYYQLMMIISHTKNPPYKKAYEAAVTRL